jgi:hypothetical protein
MKTVLSGRFPERLTVPKSKTIRLAMILAASSPGLFNSPCTGAAQTPGPAANAAVKTETLLVYSEMDSSSGTVQSLKKGDSVYLDLQVDQSGMSWCGVRLAGQTSRLGYVSCKALERIPARSPIQPGKSGVTASGPAKPATGDAPLERPSLRALTGYDAMKAQVVQEGVIDSVYIAKLEYEARSGSALGMSKAALAHLAAGEFEMSQHEIDRAMEHFGAAEQFSGGQTELLLASLIGQGYGYIYRSEFSAALDVTTRARRIAPRSAMACAMSGWAHYRLNQIDAAIEDWKTAQRLQASPVVAQLLEKVQREKEAEGDFREGESSHFILRYNGHASHQLAYEVIHKLEEQYDSLRSDLHFTPPEPIGVVLYTQETFRDVTRAPNWAGASNDGRIRIPVQGVESVSDLLARILKHELTHSFVYQKTGGRCPTWLDEGIAQWMEGRRTGSLAGPLRAAHPEEKRNSLHYYEGSWQHLSAPQARFAYSWSLAVVESIIANSGIDGVNRLLDATRTESSPEDALREALRTNYEELATTAVEYLQQTYPE